MLAPAEDSGDEEPGPLSDEWAPVRAVIPKGKELSEDISDLRDLVKDLAKTISQLVQRQSNPLATPQNATSQRVGEKSKPRCYKCKGYGHYSRECRVKGGGDSQPKCFKCQGYGHYSRECKAKGKNGSQQEAAGQCQRNEHSRDIQSMREAKALAKAGISGSRSEN